MRMAYAVTLCGLVSCAGCWRRVVLVPPGEPVRLGQSVRARVWVAAQDGTEIQADVTLPEGWWVLPDLGEDAKK